MKLAVTLLLVGAFSVGSVLSKKSYDGYSVFRVDINTPEELEILNKLGDNQFVDFWTQPRLGFVDVMLNATGKDAFADQMRSKALNFHTMIPNVGTLLKVEEHRQAKAKANGKAGAMDWESYHDLDTMYAYFDDLEASNSDVTTESIGQSYEGRDMRVIKICRGGCGNKPAMWIDGGIHAREWISPASVMWIVRELTENLSAENEDLVENIDWYILPVANPDGYAYSISDDRLWRKTRTVYEGNTCVGVDANRNWGYEWNTGGSSGNSCFDTYHGPEAFSEVENRNMRDFLTANKDQIKYYNNVHSYSQLILLPWGFTEEPCPGYDDMFDLMTRANEALYAVHQKTYDVGCIPCMLYVASGGSIDWTLGEIGVKYSIGMELRDTGFWGFLLPPEQIIPNGEEVFAFHTVVARQLMTEFA